MTEKISFLFLVYDEIENDGIWSDFLYGVSEEKYTIHIHYKPEIKNVLPSGLSKNKFSKHKIKECTRTKWADVSLVKAQSLLLKEALKDKSNQGFVFLSQSCVPVKPFEEIYLNLLSCKKSIFNQRPLEWDERYGPIKKLLPMLEIQKASQWSILNRKHAEALSSTESFENNYWYDIFTTVFAPDEIMYFTLLRNTFPDNEFKITKDLCHASTFTNWGPMPPGKWNEMGYLMPEYKWERPEQNRVKTYNTIQREELEEIVESDSMFARKFNKNCTVGNKKESLRKYLKKHLTSADNHL